MVWLPDSYESIYRKAQQLALVEDYQGAIGEYRRLFKRLASFQPSLLERRSVLRNLLLDTGMRLAQLLQEEEEYEEAVKVKELLAEKDPDNRGRWLREIGELLIERGDVEEGLEFLRDLAEEEPRDALNWIFLGQRCAGLERFEEGLTYLEKGIAATRTKRERGLGWLSMADIQRRAGRYDEAAEAWERAAEADPEQVGGVAWIYLMFIEAGEYAKARQYLAREENKFLSNFYAGRISWLQGNRAGARRAWRLVAGWEPGKNLAEQECWAEACLRIGQTERVSQALEEFLAENPTTPKLLLLLATAQAALANVEAARAPLGEIQRRLKRAGARETRIAPEGWRLFDAVVEDETIKSELAEYFAEEG